MDYFRLKQATAMADTFANGWLIGLRNGFSPFALQRTFYPTFNQTRQNARRDQRQLPHKVAHFISRMGSIIATLQVWVNCVKDDVAESVNESGTSFRAQLSRVTAVLFPTLRAYDGISQLPPVWSIIIQWLREFCRPSSPQIGTWWAH